MVAPVDEIALGHHVGLLVRMDGNVGRDALFLRSSLSWPTLQAVSAASDTVLTGSVSGSAGAAFHSPSDAWVTGLHRMKPPSSTMTFSW